MRKIQMNDKLRQFEKESKLEIFGLGARREIWERALEKYAELIVRECANEILKWKSEPFPYDPEFGAKLIKKHFGVKE